MVTRRKPLRASFVAALRAVAGATVLCCATSFSWADWSTVVDNGPAANRVDIVFVGDGYTQAQLDSGLYAAHVQEYLDYLWSDADALTDPFPRYKNFFNVHQIEVASQESGADRPSQGIFRNTALDATYETSGIDRLLTINTSKANAAVNENLSGTGITADMRMATVNDATYGGSGGTWAVYAGPNGQARELAIHELSHAFSKTADEYVTRTGAYTGGEPAAVNATKDPSGAKWSHWLGFEDPRADYLDIGAYEGAADYPAGVYRPSLDSKMRTLSRPFNAVVREKTILDIYQHVNPLDSWLANSAPVEDSALWVDTVDPEVISIDWYVDDQLVAADYGEQFDLAAFDFPSGTYAVRADAYDGIVRHAGDGSLLDLVRVGLDQLQQQVSWTVELTVVEPIPGDYNGDRTVDDADLVLWRLTFGSTDELAADGNGDRIVDAADYTVWRNNLGGALGGPGAGGSQVPEPGAIALVGSALVGYLWCGWGPRRGAVSWWRRCV
jgi:hypothetical protein